jgi:hypothetical protein
MSTYSVYYMRPDFFRDGLMGADWLRERGMLPDPGALDRTHVFLLEATAPNLDALYLAMQSEHWSPNGEARPLIELRGLQHTSMSVGDIAVDQTTFQAYIVDCFGFAELGGPR